MATMQVEIVSAEKSILSVEASEVYARTLEGEVGILPGHQPCLFALDIAPVRVKLEDGTEERAAVHRGFLYYRGDTLVVLADIAELASDIDVRQAEARKREMEEQLAREEDAVVRASVRKQTVRLTVAG